MIGDARIVHDAAGGQRKVACERIRWAVAGSRVGCAPFGKEASALRPKLPAADPNAAKYDLFIDTNIWLDFYRLVASEKMLGAPELIGHARNRLISTD